MSSLEPILSEFLTKEELAAELRRNVRTLDRWACAPSRTTKDMHRSYCALSANKGAEMARHRKSSSAAARTDAYRLIKP